MLHKNTVTPECWYLLEELTSLSFLDSFRLVGGTALSLQEGHRLSDDIDLFAEEDFDIPLLKRNLQYYYSPAQLSGVKLVPFGIFCYIRDIKVDLMYWGDAYIFPALIEEEIKMARQEDILAMKLAAINSRASKKDFFDLALLLKKFTIKQGLDFYEQKYPHNDPVPVLKSLTNFENADLESDPVLLNSPSWGEVKELILRDFYSFFGNLPAAAF